MSEVTSPKIGFVSLGCPKALTDSELILTQLRLRQTAGQLDGNDLEQVDRLLAN